MTTPPRTAIVSYAPPDGKYIVLRRIVEQFPKGRIAWISTVKPRGEGDWEFPYRCAAPRRAHWRLAGTSLSCLYEYEMQTLGIAGSVARWLQDFRPEVLWVLAEQGAAQLGYALHRMTGLPIHAMVQDAHQTAWHILPKAYYPIYDWRVRRLLSSARTCDGICRELIDWTVKNHPNLAGVADSMVFSPSVTLSLMESVAEPACYSAGEEERRIGMCGTVRIGVEQWKSFLRLLSCLPWKFRILATVNREAMPDCQLPDNVRIDLLPFAPDEESIIKGMHATGVHACYLGLWKEPEKRLFSTTSLSAKMTTYAAAKLPIIVDGPDYSAAWRLVKAHGAGVLCADNTAASLEALKRLFSEPAAWGTMARGAASLCRAEYCLEDNVETFFRLLCRCAYDGTRVGSAGKTHHE